MNWGFPYMKIDKDLLTYEMILSQGKGLCTGNFAKMVETIASLQIMVRHDGFKSVEDRDDCRQEGIFYALKSWKTADLRFGRDASPYVMECIKRGFYHYVTSIAKYKTYGKTISLDSVLQNNHDNNL